MLVEDVMSDISKCPSLVWVSSFTPFVDGGGKSIETGWVWKAKLRVFFMLVVGLLDES